MFVKGFGEVVTDALTVNPALADLPTAAPILDASNYTFQTVTFGKDGEGFTHHAHTVKSIDYVEGNSASGASGYDSGLLIITNLASDTVSAASSYVPSGAYLQFSSTYKSVPNDPSPLDTRLERTSTLSTNLSDYQYASALPDVGHYANPALNSQLSSIWNKVGGFAPSGPDQQFYFYDRSDSFVYSGSVSSFFNANGQLNRDGYLRISPTPYGYNVSVPNQYLSGSIITASAGVAELKDSKFYLQNRVMGGDALTLVAFGSVKHIGVHCFDLKQMLASGLMPPYNWSHLDNNSKYKLVAKATILDNPFYHRDADPGTSGSPRAGLGVILKDNNVILSLVFDFK